MQPQTILKIYATTLLATIMLLLVFIFLNRHFDGSIWNDMQISKSALKAEYCELNQTSKLFHQTMNTYSNLAYFFLGIIAILVAFFDTKDKQNLHRNLIQKFPLISSFFGCCLVYLCFGSAFFHASLTWIGQRADMNATYSICITLIGISFYRLFVKEDIAASIKIAFILSLLIIIIALLRIHLLISSIILLPLLIGLIIISTAINYLRNKRNFKLQLALLSLILMIGAFILRTMDVEKFGCDPLSVYQGHALWHFFTGMSAFLLYWFYRSERVE